MQVRLVNFIQGEPQKVSNGPNTPIIDHMFAIPTWPYFPFAGSGDLVQENTGRSSV